MPFRRIVVTILVLDFMMLLFAASAVLSLFAAYDPHLSYGTMIALVVSVGLFFVVVRAARLRRNSRLIAGGAVLIGLEVSLFFVTQFDYQKYPETPNFIQLLGRITTILPNFNGGYLHPNAVATFLEMVLPIGVALVIVTRGSRWRWLWVVCTLVMAYAFLLTASRGGWLGLAVSGVIWFVTYRMWGLSRTKIVLLAGVVVLVAVGIISALIILGPQISALNSTFETAAVRLQLYRNSLYLIRDYAFTGIGLGDTFAMVYSRYGLMIFVPSLSYSHNLPLAVWFGQGLVGILTFIGMVIAFYVYVYQVIRRARGGALFYGAWIGVTSTLLHGLTDARQYTESPWVMPTLFFGMGFAVACGARALIQSRAAQVIDANPPAPASWRKPVLAAVVIVMLVAGGLLVFREPLQAMWYTNLGALDETRADTFIAPKLDETERNQLESSAQSWYEKALAISPTLATANRRLGNLLVSQGDYAQAVPLLEQAAAQEAENPAAIKGLGLAYVWVGRTADAAATLNRLPDPDDASNELVTWNSYRESLGQHLLAAYALETAVLMSKDTVPNLGLWLLIADDYNKGDDTGRARQWYEQVLEYDAHNQQALDGLAALGQS